MSQIKKFLFIFPIVLLVPNVYAVDCTIETTQATNISSTNPADPEYCDSGFELVTTQNYDITISSGVVLTDNDYVIEIGWPFNAVLTNNGTISNISDKTIWINNASLQELNNSGTIDGINEIISINNSTLTLLNNSGTIDAGNQYAIYNVDGSTISSLENSGTITAYDSAITNRSSTISSLINTNTISSTAGGHSIYNSFGSITTLNNSGSISSVAAAIYNSTDGSIQTLTNSGTISSSTSVGIHNYDNGSITTLENTSSGTISANLEAIYNESLITTLTNEGTISSTTSESITNAAGGTITSLTNTGTITAASSSFYDIYNNGTITTLNNDQGFATSDPINYYGSLPDNYNIIINSTTDYGQVEFESVSGDMNFGIHSSSTLESATYTAVFSGISYSSQLNDTTSGTVTNNGKVYSWSLENTAATSWDLTLAFLRNVGPSAADTQNSIRAIKGQLQGNLNSLTAGANFANMNTYDCNFFDTKGGCFSFGNRYTDIQSPSIQTNSFVATGGYKIDNHFRVAGFIDQNLNYNMAHNIDVENKGPLVGLIGVWNQHANLLGWQIKVANAYQSKDASIKRSVTGTSEAGKGKTDIDTQSYVAELSYNHAMNSSLLIRPYIALRYAMVKQDGYTETGVDNPLTYNTIRDRSKTALVGVKVKKRLTDKVVAIGSMGLEHDLSHKTDNLEASGVSGLTSESFSNNLDKTRPVASLGADYYIDQTQRLSVNAFYQELPFASTKSRTLYINYMLGF